MTTVLKTLEKKTKALKEKIETVTPVHKSKEEIAQQRRDQMAVINGNRALIKKEIATVKTKLEKKDIEEIAKLSGLSVKATRGILTGKGEWKEWKRRQVRMIDTIGLVTLKNLITTVSSGRLSPYSAGMMFQILRGQILREPKKTEATTSINIGDNRKVSVYYPNFTPKDKKDEFATAKDID